MLERSLFRRRFLFGAQILFGVVASALSFDFAFAQSPAAFPIYNRAASLGGGGFNAGGAGGANFANPGVGAFNSDAPNGLGAANSFDANALNNAIWQSLLVAEPEYVYRQHVENEPIVSLEVLSSDYAILSASGDKTAKIWTIEGVVDPMTTQWSITGSRTRKTYEGVHKQGLTAAVVSPDESFILTASYDGVGRLWTIANQENIRAYLGAKDRLWSIAVAPSGMFVGAACNDGRVYFWESTTVKKLGNLPNREDAQRLGTGFEEVGHDGPVFDVAFDPNSQFCATAGADGTIRIWNLAQKREVAVLKGHVDKVYSVRFSNDGQYLLSASRDKTARLWNPSTGQEVCRFVGHLGAVRKAIFFNEASSNNAAAYSQAGDSSTFGSSTNSSPMGGASVGAGVPSGLKICTASDDGTVRVWNIGSSAGSGANALASSGNVANPGYSDPSASGSYNSGSYNYDDATTGAQNQNVAKPTRKAGKTKGIELYSFVADNPVFSIAASADGVYVFGGCLDGTVRIWRVPGMARYYDASQNADEYGTENGGYETGSNGGYGGAAYPNSGYPASNGANGLR